MSWALGLLALHLSGTASLADNSAMTPSALVYPRPTPSIPCVSEACDNIQFVDFSLLRFGADDELEIGTRLRLGDWAFLSAEVGEENQSLGLTTSRWSFDLHSDQVSEGLEAEYRAPRYLRLRSSALRDTPADSDGWLNEGELALRLGANLELFIRTLEDNRTNSERIIIE